MKILIVGAGFGGLALAAYLQRDGHVVTIVEKSKEGWCYSLVETYMEASRKKK